MSVATKSTPVASPRFDAAALADTITKGIGSWRFIIFQSFLMLLWFLLNTAGWFVWHWDPYPFVFLNLFMSMEAAYATPIILMSGNRQQERDESQREADSETLRRIEQIEKVLDAHVNGTAQEHSKQLQELRLIVQELHTQLCPNSELPAMLAASTTKPELENLTRTSPKPTNGRRASVPLRRAKPGKH